MSAIIITKNEEKNVAKCLQSLLGVADEIVVVDSYSTDKTIEICKSFGAVVLQMEWMGYSETKNRGNAAARFDWILSLDADEALSPELKKSILNLKHSGFQHPVYAFNRLTSYCGQWIRHGGWYPDVKPRLFNRNQARWQGEYVHEKLVFAGDIQPVHIAGDLWHYSIPDIAAHIQVVNRYSSLAAEEQLARGKQFSFFKLVFSPPLTFIKMYLLKAGFLDGMYGFIIAVISAHYRFLKYAKMRKKG